MIEAYFTTLLQEVDRHTATISLEGENIIPGCREMMAYLKDKMIELKNYVLCHEFKDDAQEIRFFKHQKPLLLGRFLYFYRLYQIESNCPPCMELAVSYYQCEIEKLKTVSERSLSFFRVSPKPRLHYLSCSSNMLALSDETVGSIKNGVSRCNHG